MAGSTVNNLLKFLPPAGEGRFWEIKLRDPLPLTKPLKVTLRQRFKEGVDRGDTVGVGYADAYEKSIRDTADDVLLRFADTQKYLGTHSGS
jgi:hypothetical protein